MRDQSGSGWKFGIVTFFVALVTFGVAWWFTRRETGAMPVWSSDLERATARPRPSPAGPGQATVVRSDGPGPGGTSGTGPSATDALTGASDPDGGRTVPNADDSADPLPDGSPPPGFPIKGNTRSMLYHPPESPNYGRTRAQTCFRTAEAAEAAGFQHWNARRRK
jgi:hypothetical protein